MSSGSVVIFVATAKDYIKAAAKYIGISGTDNIFNTWIWGKHVYDPDDYPWCAAFQSYVAVHDLGIRINPSASAAGVANQGRRVDDSEVQPGDWVVFNWDGRTDTGWCDHIGLVEWFDHDTDWFGTIEGNYGDRVTRVTRDNNGPYFTAFFRPPYNGKTSTTTSPSKKKEQPRYRVEVKSDGKYIWLPEMIGKYDTGGSTDTYAGVTGSPITGLMVKGVGKYRVKTQKHGWLEYADGYSIGDHENGYAGYQHSPITAVHIPNTKVKVQVRLRGNSGFSAIKQGRAAGDVKTPIDAVRIVWA